MLESFEYKGLTYTVHTAYGLIMLYPSIVVDEENLPDTLIAMGNLRNDDSSIERAIRLINFPNVEEDEEPPWEDPNFCPHGAPGDYK